LRDGKVFLTGGYTTATSEPAPGGFPPLEFLKTSEVFDLRGNTWVPGVHSDVPRLEHTATLFDDGTVLVVGSAYASNADSQIFDPANSENWIPTGMQMDRYLHTATKLVDGRVLIAGGYGVGSANSAWLYSSQSIMPATSYSPSTGLLIAAFLALVLLTGLIVRATSPRWQRRGRRATPPDDAEWIDP
jgi:hypothetical protein